MKQQYSFFLMGLLFLSLSFGQSNKKDIPIKDQIWNSGESNNNVTIPDEWKDESAVFLTKDIKYIYNRPKNSIEYTKIIHERVQLLDQAAVTEFSEFKYQKDESYFSYGLSRVTHTFTIGVKIIKPDGTTIEVDTDEVIEGDNERKLAIPNLEKGDIIDYFFHTNVILGENDLYQYKPVENVIGDTYPILDYKFTLETEKDFFINFNTYNGAPKLEKIADPNAKKRNKKRLYTFALTNVAKNDFPRWFYPLVELPSYKFQVNFARTGKYEKKAYAFIPKEADSIKTAVVKSEIFEFYEDKFRPYGNLGGVERFLKEKNFSTNEEKVKAVFYYIRHAYFTNYIEAFIVSDAKIMYPFDYYGKNPIFFQKEEEFIRFFAAFLKDNKIDYEILIGTKRFNGNIKDLLLESNVNFLLKINTEKPIYIEYFNHFANVNLISPQLESTEAYALKVANRKKIEDIQTITLPTSTYQDNNTTEKLTLNLNSDFSAINVKRHSIYKGHNKVAEQRDRLNFYDYVYEDYDKYETKSLLDKVKKKKLKEKYQKEFDALISKLKDKQKESFQKQTSREYDLELSDYDFSIEKNGRFGKSDTFEFKESFSLANNLIKKAGKNYIIQIGKLIGTQVDLDEKQKQRTNNVYMNHPRSFINEITLTIPEGYTVAGLDKLNTKVDNTTGAFISTATVDGSTLTIKTEKCYKNYYEPNSNWTQMVDFLEAAYQFTQEKILLKKQ